jgi:hypothetical protein
MSDHSLGLWWDGPAPDEPVRLFKMHGNSWFYPDMNFESGVLFTQVDRPELAKELFNRLDRIPNELQGNNEATYRAYLYWASKHFRYQKELEA